MRRAFSDTLTKLAAEDDRVIFLTADLGFGVFEDFIARFPTRYINVGVAEALLVDCAAGLALEGWRPVVYSIASFMTGRAFEQIRVAVGYHRLPVTVVGAGGGYIYGDAGVTHHAKEDLALMALIAGMTVVVPGDPNEVEELLPQLITAPGPSYIRIGRFGEPRLLSDSPIVLGQGRMIREGEKVGVLTTGSALVHAAAALDRLSPDGIRPALCHFHTIRPLDTEMLDTMLRRFETVIVVEDHGVQGGFFAAVAQRCAQTGLCPDIVRLGPSDDLVIGNPKQAALQHMLGSDADGIAAACRAAWSRMASRLKSYSHDLMSDHQLGF